MAAINTTHTVHVHETKGEIKVESFIKDADFVCINIGSVAIFVHRAEDARAIGLAFAKALRLLRKKEAAA